MGRWSGNDGCLCWMKGSTDATTHGAAPGITLSKVTQALPEWMQGRVSMHDGDLLLEDQSDGVSRRWVMGARVTVPE